MASTSAAGWSVERWRVVMSSACRSWRGRLELMHGLLKSALGLSGPAGLKSLTAVGGRLHTQAGPRHRLTTADLAAARRGEPAAVAQTYTAYAPAPPPVFLAAVGDRHVAEYLTGAVLPAPSEPAADSRPGRGARGLLVWIARLDLVTLLPSRRAPRSP
jgi:hypothetical protein